MYSISGVTQLGSMFVQSTSEPSKTLLYHISPTPFKKANYNHKTERGIG